MVPRKRSGAACINTDWQKLRAEHTPANYNGAARTSLHAPLLFSCTPDFANMPTLCAFCFPVRTSRLCDHAAFCFPAARPTLQTSRLCAPFLFSRHSHKHNASRFPSTSHFPSASRFPSALPHLHLASPPLRLTFASPRSASPAKPSQAPNKSNIE
jgi:hypothetical protein